MSNLCIGIWDVSTGVIVIAKVASKLLDTTMAKTEITYPENVGTSVAMNFT